MTDELILILGRPLQNFLEMNLALAAGVILVALVRRPVRTLFGAEAAYRLWWAPLAGALAVTAPRPGASTAGGGVLDAANWTEFAGPVWLAGAVLTSGAMVWGQWRFHRSARAGRAGPALVGLFTPRVVMPADSTTRWTAEQLALVRAHERAHLERGDARVNAFAAAVQIVCWFNPAVHMAVRLLRFDQELACDAAVMARRPGQRRIYAEALLRAGTIGPAAPLGCGWSSDTARTLGERIGALTRNHDVRSADHGAVAAVLTGAVLAVGAWAAQPALPAPPEPAPGPRVMLMDISPTLVR